MSFVDMVNAFKGVMSPQAFEARREEERERRIATTAKAIFDQLIRLDRTSGTLTVEGLMVETGNNLPKNDQEWEVLVARIIRAGWQCRLRNATLKSGEYVAAIQIAGPGEEFTS